MIPASLLHNKFPFLVFHVSMVHDCKQKSTQLAASAFLNSWLVLEVEVDGGILVLQLLDIEDKMQSESENISGQTSHMYLSNTPYRGKLSGGLTFNFRSSQIGNSQHEPLSCQDTRI